MSGSKRRLGTSADGQFGLTDKQLEMIIERSSKKNIPQKTTLLMLTEILC